MSAKNSVSQWLETLKAGEKGDIDRLWDRYFRRLVQLARTRLPDQGRRAFDEEDIALSAFHSFCERVGQGQFPRLEDRDDLWRVLFTITTRKVLLSLRRQSRQKRGGGRVLGESVLDGSGDVGTPGIAAFLGREPTPEDAAEFAEQYERLLASLGDDVLRTIAARKLEGFSAPEIAAALGVSTRTVNRKTELIQAIWDKELLV